MTKANYSELALLLMGTVGLAVLFVREYRSVVVVSHNSALADTPRETVRRALVLALKIWIAQRFSAVDRVTLDDYRRFKRVIDLLVWLTAINLLLLIVIFIGLIMVLQQTKFESIIRPTDLSLMVSYVTVFLVGYSLIDRLYDAITDRQSNPSSNGRVREQPFRSEAVRRLQLQEEDVRKPKAKKVPEGSVPLGPEPAAIYTRLSPAEREALKRDPEAVKRELIAAGILDEDGEVRDVYKRS